MVRPFTPSGVGEWNGDWSDHSAAWSGVVATTDGSGLTRTGVDDGTFWMELMPFFSAFALVDVCLAHRDWHANSFSNAFCAKRSPWRVCESVFTVTAVRSTPAYFMALQPTKRGAAHRTDRKNSYRLGDLCLVVVQLSGGGGGGGGAVLGMTVCGARGRGDALSVELEPSVDYTVLVYNIGSPPSAAETTTRQPFTVRMYSKSPLRVSLVLAWARF